MSSRSMGRDDGRWGALLWLGLMCGAWSLPALAFAVPEELAPVAAAQEEMAAQLAQIQATLAAMQEEKSDSERTFLVQQQMVLQNLEVLMAELSHLYHSVSFIADQVYEPYVATTTPTWDLRLAAEAGFLAPLYHRIKYGKGGDTFDYLKEGGQDVLFPTMRMSAELRLGQAHGIIFLYQPIDIRTRVNLTRSLNMDGTEFSAGTGMDLRYGFDFYRASYLYDFFGDDPGVELSIGASLQIRNAIIEFMPISGRGGYVNRGVGPVPILKMRGRYTFPCGVWLGGEVDGFYAPIKYINGGKSDVEGAIIDLSARVGVPLQTGVDLFLNTRYIGGGAEGTSSRPAPSDGFTANWLHFFAVTLGVQWDVRRSLD